MKIYLLLSSLVLLAGCVSSGGQAELDSLKKEISKLQIKCAGLESRQAELYSKFEENLVNTDTNKASIQELYKKTEHLSQEVSEMSVVLKKKTDNNTSTVAEIKVPSKLYENAYNDFLLGKYEVAIMGFKTFIKQYKEHDLAVQAQYYIAESLYSQNKFADAYKEYGKIETNYPNSEFIASSRLKMALCLELLGKEKDSIIVLQSILKNFPKSSEAFTAKEKIKIYNAKDTNGKKKSNTKIIKNKNKNK
jgi:tol-pal system protein YbgF